MSAGRRRILHVDASSGASGDMVLGALVDLGVSVDHLRAVLSALPLGGWALSARQVERQGLRACKVSVDVHDAEEGRHPRGWDEIHGIIAGASLPTRVRAGALAIFRRLVEAEASVHGVAVEATHLHEVGAVDAIVDVVGACAGFDHLSPDRIVVSRLTTGSGTVRCEHGTYPVPAPATAELVRGIPVQAGLAEGERLTPTGAAILTTIADAWGPLPGMRPDRIGYGAGDRDGAEGANVLRMILGEEDGDDAGAAHGGPEVLVLEANVDDAPPQVVAYACERLFEAGALEVYTTAVQMKKGRTGHELTVLARPRDLPRLADVLLRETTTLGLRHRIEHRIELARHQQVVSTAWGDVRVKLGERDGRLLQAWPEYEDCAAIARRHDVPLREVQQAALRALEDSP